MKIKEYMKKNKHTHRSFAKLIGINHSTIFHFLSGRNKSLSLPIIQKIVNGTNGKITLQDIMEEIAMER